MRRRVLGWPFSIQGGHYRMAVAIQCVRCNTETHEGAQGSPETDYRDLCKK